MPESYFVFVIVGVVAAVFLIPLALRFTQRTVSPYPPADRSNRLVAGAVDLTVAAACYAALAPENPIVAVTVSPLYLLFRDGIFAGQSLGKMCVGQVVIRLSSGNRGRMIDSIRRNFIFVIPGMNLVALPVELTQTVKDQQGMRVGDRLAGTQVIDGKDAKDLITFLKETFDLLEEELHGRNHTPR